MSAPVAWQVRFNTPVLTVPGKREWGPWESCHECHFGEQHPGLELEYRALYAAPYPQPIDTAPKDGTHILVFDTGAGDWGAFGWCVASWCEERRGTAADWHDCFEGFPLKPTHWAPLPEVPK